jgi:hypothetical protein
MTVAELYPKVKGLAVEAATAGASTADRAAAQPGAAIDTAPEKLEAAAVAATTRTANLVIPRAAEAGADMLPEVEFRRGTADNRREAARRTARLLAAGWQTSARQEPQSNRERPRLRS